MKGGEGAGDDLLELRVGQRERLHQINRPLRIGDSVGAQKERLAIELGVLAGIEEEVSAERSTYTRPEEVVDFTKRTGVDSLAISIGTSHGAYKFKVKPGEPPPTLVDYLPPDAMMSGCRMCTASLSIRYRQTGAWPSYAA